MKTPLATIVIVPRERFSGAQRSLESIVDHTRVPHEIVYVDGGSPRNCRHYLERQARALGMNLQRHNRYLSPNQARNLGWRQVQTKYTVFVDNDVVVSPGWLKALVRCAEETGAGVVGPLTCQYEPVHSEIHCAGGESGIRIENDGAVEKRFFVERIYDQGRKVAQKLPTYVRQVTGLAEFHCVLAKTDLLHAMEGLDEGLLSAKEHVDFSISATSLNETIYFEPESIVTYVPGPPLALSDLQFYMLRWSDAWERASLLHLREKYQLCEEGWLTNRLKNVGWRRLHTIVRPLSRRIMLGVKVKPVESLLWAAERPLNRYLTNRHAKAA